MTDPNEVEALAKWLDGLGKQYDDMSEAPDAAAMLRALAAERDAALAAKPAAPTGEALDATASDTLAEVTEGELAEEARIDGLRHKAFLSNSKEDRQRYFEAVTKWFDDRHYRRMGARAALGDKP